ncbi:MAG: magnesium transporter CorA family protein [Acidaminococcaceae bacterium]|nr:magnesium transporter CorA family protein [Acidaminococcaceae bacterium]
MINVYCTESSGLKQMRKKKLNKGCWIDMVAPTHDELVEVAAATGLQMDFLSAALDDDEKSRIEVDEDQILVLGDIPFLRSNKDFEALPLGIIINRDYIVTVCLEANGVTAGLDEKNGRGRITQHHTNLLYQILYRAATLYLKYIRIIIKRTDELERHLRVSMENAELFNLLDLQKSLTIFSTSLKSDNMVIERLNRLRATGTSNGLISNFEEDEDLLDDVIIEFKQATEMVEMYSHILNSMMEVFASIISNNLNLVMKFLASVTIMLAIPTLISGLWGMNVPVPFADTPYGFAIVMVLAVIIGGSAGYILWRKHMF